MVLVSLMVHVGILTFADSHLFVGLVVLPLVKSVDCLTCKCLASLDVTALRLADLPLCTARVLLRQHN